MNTAIPPNGVTARCVSRRISRPSDNRALISRGTGLSAAFVSIPLLSQILGSYLTLNFGDRPPSRRRIKSKDCPRGRNRSGDGRSNSDPERTCCHDRRAADAVAALGVKGDRRLRGGVRRPRSRWLWPPPPRSWK